MIRFALGVAVGYVLGARAGRERYDELVRMYHRMVDHPAVQNTAGAVRAKVDEKMGWGDKRGQHEQAPSKAGQGDKVVSEVDRQKTATTLPTSPTSPSRT